MADLYTFGTRDIATVLGLTLTDFEPRSFNMAMSMQEAAPFGNFGDVLGGPDVADRVVRPGGNHRAVKVLLRGEQPGRHALRQLQRAREQLVDVQQVNSLVEVAHELGIDCALVAAGHHPADRLRQVTTRVYPDLHMLAAGMGLVSATPPRAPV